MGLYVGEVDGQFGVLTEEAVLLLQLCFVKPMGGPVRISSVFTGDCQQGAWLVHRKAGTRHRLPLKVMVWLPAPRVPGKVCRVWPAGFNTTAVWLLWGEWYTTVECTGCLPAHTEGDRIPN